MAGMTDPAFSCLSIRRELFWVIHFGLGLRLDFLQKHRFFWLIYIKIVMTLVERDEYA